MTEIEALLEKARAVSRRAEHALRRDDLYGASLTQARVNIETIARLGERLTRLEQQDADRERVQQLERLLLQQAQPVPGAKLNASR